MDTANAIVDLIAGLAASAAAAVALWGISAWRREYIGKRRADLSQEALALFYECRDALAHIRNPVSFGGECAKREGSEEETREEKEARDQAYIPYARYEQHKDAFNSLRALRYRYMAQFGVSECEHFDAVHSALNRVFLAAGQLSKAWAKYQRPGLSPERQDKLLQLIQEEEKVFWSHLSEDDELSSKVDAAVEAIERTARREMNR